MSGSDKIPDTSATVKQFSATTSGYAVWIYKKISNIMFITTTSVSNVLIQKDLVVNGSVTHPSDIILKENIENLNDDLCDKILKITPKKYNYKSDDNKKIRYGVIAQEIEHYFPDLVSNNIDHNGTSLKSLNYIDMIPILLGKMQKMQKEIDELKLKLNHDEINENR
jgi:hypothetical protein